MGIQHRLVMRIKNNKLVRTLCKPWMDRKLNNIYQEYLLSEDSQRIKGFKDRYAGERCFIIGNGPSLKAADLDKLQGEYTFSANRIYEIFDQTDWRPWVYVVQDKGFMSSESDAIRQVPCTWKFVPHEVGVDTSQWDNTIQIHGGLTEFVVNRGNDLSAVIVEDVSKGFSNGHTVTFISIQLAIYMGFKEIYLLGVDFQYSYIMDKHGHFKTQPGVKDYFNGDSHGKAVQNLEPTRNAYQVARKYCDAHGIVIKNATRGGKLEVFERVDFDSLFEN